MKINLLVRVRKLFNSDMVPPATNRYNQREWARKTRAIGSRHLMHAPISRPGTAVVLPCRSRMCAAMVTPPTPLIASEGTQ